MMSPQAPGNKSLNKSHEKHYSFPAHFELPRHCYGQNLKSGGKLSPEQAIMDIRHYTVSLTVNPEQQTIDGYTEIDLILSQPADRLVFDLTRLLTGKKSLGKW